MEVSKQTLADELQAAKHAQLDDMAAEVRRELAKLEKQRVDMQIEMTRKQADIEAIQQEVLRAEEQLRGDEQAKLLKRNGAKGGGTALTHSLQLIIRSLSTPISGNVCLCLSV